MTCIVGIEYKNRVFLGGDSAASDGHRIYTVDKPKVFVLDKFVIGYTVSFRYGQLLQYSLTIPKHDPDVPDLTYLSTHFVDNVRACLKSKGFAEVENNVEKGGFCLLGYKGKLYTMQGDFSVVRFLGGICATGSGVDYALGAMYSCGKQKPMDILASGLHAAANFVTTVREPFHFVVEPQ